MPQPEFRDRVYTIVRAIPVGEVMTYGEVAARSGNPSAARAVGTLMRGNPKSFLTHPHDPAAIPCHRVVGAGRTLGGFNGGPTAKRRLLKQEGWCMIGDRLVSEI